MSNSNLSLALEIALQTSNLQELSSLTEQLKGMGVDVSELSEKSGHLNDTFKALETKQGLIELFRAQKLAVVDAAAAWQGAQDATKTLGDEWQAAKAKAEELRLAMEASDEVTQAQKDEYKAAAKEVEDYAKAHAKSAKEAGKLKQEHTNLNAELVATRQSMADAGLSTTDLSGQSVALQAETEAAAAALAELTAEAENLNEIAKAKITLGIETDDAALAQIEEINRAYELLRDSGTLTSEELAAATEAHAQQVQELENSLAGATDQTTDFATEFAKVTAAAGGLTIVAKAAMDFEVAMAGVRKTVDGSPEQINALSSQIKQLSIELGLTSESVADIAAQGGQLGIPIEKLGEFTEMAGKMAIAFGISAEEAAQSAAELANVFAISMVDVEALGDAINTLGNNTAAKEPDIVNALLRIGGSAKAFGLAEEQAAALASSFIALGKAPEVAGTAINALLTKLQTAQVQSKGFQDALDDIGLSGNQLAADISADPQKALSDFLQTLSNLDEQQRAIATFKLFGQGYSDDVNLLVGSLDTYNTALGLIEDKTANAGAMQTEFEAAMSTSAAEIDRAQAAIMALTQSLGEHLLPIISATAGGVADMASAVNSFAETFPNITKLAVLIAGAKVAMVAFKSSMALAGAVGARAGISISAGMAAATTSILGANVAAGSLVAKMTSLGGLFAVAGGWTIGTAIGDSLYENIPAVRSFGDELGRGLAYLDAMVTERSFEDVRNNFETSAESAERLAGGWKNAASAAYQLEIAEKDAALATANAAREQAAANRELVNDILLTEATITQMNAALTEMAIGGEANSTAYKNFANELDDTRDTLEAMRLEAKTNDLGELLKSDLDLASEAFKTLGLDAEYFATGLDSRVSASLSAFSEIAKIAGNDTHMLARAYSAASEQAGTNAQAQAMLQQQLLAATNGNSDLADEVKRVAIEQKNAKSAADEQAAALSRLGISMDAVNQSMSASGLEMVATLKTGITAIKEQSTSADALKVALTQALDTSIDAAKTKADFDAINKTLKDAGVTGQVAADQMQLIKAGMQGGADAAANAATAIDAQTKSLNDNNVATTYNSDASKDNAKAKKEQADATDKAASSTNKAAQAESASLAFIQQVTGAIKGKISALEELAGTTGQTDAAFEKLMTSMGFVDGYRFSGLPDFANQMNRVHEAIDRQAVSFEQAKNRADEMTQALSGSAVTSRDLTDAQHALRQATDANVQGLIRMDEQTLSGLQSAIDGARQRMQGLSDDATRTAENLEAALAKLQGNDDKARDIEQSRKLTELQEKLNEAKARGNDEEITQLNRALDLQKQINREEDKKAKNQQREQSSNASNNGANNNSGNNNNGRGINAGDVVGSFNDRIIAAEERGAKRGAQLAREQFAKELMNGAKAQAR